MYKPAVLRIELKIDDENHQMALRIGGGEHVMVKNRFVRREGGLLAVEQVERRGAIRELVLGSVQQSVVIPIQGISVESLNLSVGNRDQVLRRTGRIGCSF